MTAHPGRLLTWKLNAAAAVTPVWWWCFPRPAEDRGAGLTPARRERRGRRR